jgi:tetratricopeptide (TPR) repeat protein
LPEEVQYVILVLIRLPFVAAIYFLIVFLGFGMRWMIRAVGGVSSSFAVLSGSFLSVSFIYSIFDGFALGRYLNFLYYGLEFEADNGNYLENFLSILVRGGIYYPKFLLSELDPWGIILLIVLSLALILSFGVIPSMAHGLALQKSRLENARQANEQVFGPSFQWGWLGLVTLVAIPAVLFFYVPQKSTVDTLEALEHYLNGADQAQVGNFDNAIVEYQKALELKPGMFYPEIGIGYAYLALGDLDNAELSFSRSCELFPDSWEAHSGLGWVYLQQSNADFARLEFQESLRLAPQNLDGHLGMGWIHFQKGNYDHAVQEFQEALQIDPQNLDGHLGLGWIYLDQFEIKKSQEEFEKVIALSPEFAEAHLGLGTIYYLLNDYEKALDSLDTAIRLNPNYVDAYVSSGAIYFNQDQYANAESALNKALAIQPDNYNALNWMGQVQIANYQFAKGMKTYDKAIASDPFNSDAPFNKAGALVQMGRFEEAFAVLDPFQKEDESVKPTLAYIYYQMGEVDKGDKLLQDAISRVSKLDKIEQARTYFVIALAYSAKNEFPEARKYMELAMDSFPMGPDADSYLTLSYILSSLGEFEEAEEALHQASLIGHSGLSLGIAKTSLLLDQEDLAGAKKEAQSVLAMDEESSSAHELMAFVFFEEDDFSLSMQEAGKAIALNPYNGSAHSQLAFAYHALGRLDDAVPEAEEGVRLNPLNDASHYILGVCYMEKGMKAEAVAEFEKFLATYRDRGFIRDYKVKAEEYLAQLK